jgi:hypothetical protein
MLSPYTNVAAPRRRPRRPERRLRHSPAGILQPSTIDGRSRFARRFRKLSEEFAAEIGGPLTSIERILIRTAVDLVIRAEGEADVDAAVRLASESRRLLESLKAKAAKAKPAAPSIHDLLAEIADEPEAEA